MGVLPSAGAPAVCPGPVVGPAGLPAVGQLVAPVLPLSDAEVLALGEGRVVVRDDVLGPGFAAACADAVRALEDAMSPAGVGRDKTLDRTIRGDETVWLADVADQPVLGALHGWFDALRVALNEGCWLGLARFSVQVARYPGDGTGYAAHLDALAGSQNRRVTAILYLNPSWRPEHGGALRVVEPDGERFLEPLHGRLALFLSDRVEHEVLPCHAPRWAVTAWYRGAEEIPLLADVAAP